MTVHIPFTDIVGVENHPKVKTCFVVYCFAKKKQTDKKRERKVLPFICRDEQQAQNWISAIRCALRGIPFGGAYFIIFFYSFRKT